MIPGSIAAMKSFNFLKRWKYFSKSPAIVSFEQRIYRVCLDTPDPILLHSKRSKRKQ
jgi:hypothetical protein